MTIRDRKSLLIVGLAMMALVFALAQLWPAAALADDDDKGRGQSAESRNDSDDEDDKDDKEKKRSVRSILLDIEAQAAADKAELLAKIRELESEISSLSGQLADHEANVGEALVTTGNALSADVAGVYDLVYDTHTVDPLDMSITVCADTGGQAAFNQVGTIEADFNFGGMVGLDVWGTGATAEYRGHFANGLSAELGGSTALTMTACIDGIIVRQDGTVDVISEANLSEPEIEFLTNNLGDAEDAAALREALVRTARLDVLLFTDSLGRSVTELGEVNTTFIGPFLLQNGELTDLRNTVPTAGNVTAEFPNSPVQDLVVLTEPLEICSLEGLDQLLVGGNPILEICNSAGDGERLEAAILTISDTLEPAINRIDTKVEQIDKKADKIAASVGNNLRDLTQRIKNVVDSICEFLGC